MQNNSIIISTITKKSEIGILKGKTSVYWDLVIKYDETAKDTLDLLKRNIWDKDSLYLIAREKDKFVWFCSIDKEWWEQWIFFLREIFIEPRYQKHKIWKELIKRCIGHAKDRWAIWVVTQTDVKNIPMQKLCEKLWFIKWDNPQWIEWITYKLLFEDSVIEKTILKQLIVNAWIKSFKSIQKIDKLIVGG